MIIDDQNNEVNLEDEGDKFTTTKTTGENISDNSIIKYVGIISKGQDVDNIELIIDVKSDNVIEEKSTKLSLLLQSFLTAVSLLMLEINEVLDLINSTLLIIQL